MPVPSYLMERRECEVQRALHHLRALPALSRTEAGNEDTCPICLMPLESICKEHELVEEKQECSSTPTTDGVSLRASEMTGVVKLNGCGHIFCRKDLAEWIESHHGSCPACRRIFFEFTVIDEAEYESSDGGEYVPDDDDDDDVFTDDGDFDLVATSDIEFDTDDMDSNEEADIGVMGYAPLARVLTASNGEAEAYARRRAALVYAPHPSADFRVYAPNDEDDGVLEESIENEPVAGELDEAGGLSYGSDSLSSEEVSFSTEGIPATHTADVAMVFGEYNAGEDKDELSFNGNHAEVKSPVATMSGLSNGSTGITQ